MPCIREKLRNVLVGIEESKLEEGKERDGEMGDT